MTTADLAPWGAERGPGMPTVLAAQFAAARSAARVQCRARAERVRRYPDLVARMAGPPLRLDAHLWNGYVPPRTSQEQFPEVLHSGGVIGRGYPNQATRMTGPTELNVAPHRSEFVEICAAAYARDQAAGLVPPGPDRDPAELITDPPAADPVPDPGPVQTALGDWPEGSIGQAAR